MNINNYDMSAAKKYEGKTAIDAFFWRFGDLAQAGMIYAGLNWLEFGIRQFAMMNVVLSVLWLVVAWRAGKYYGKRQEDLDGALHTEAAQATGG